MNQPSLIFSLISMAVFYPLHAELPFSETLTSASENIQTENWFRDYSDFDLQVSEKWSVRKTILHGGKQEGVELIEVDNGRLRFSVIPTRGMNVYEVVMGDTRLGWHSPVKEIVHPRHINLQSRGGLGWLEGFNEWMVRCGLESAGHPGQDKFINNVGDEATMDLTLHGKIGNIPASEVQVIIEQEAPYRIRIRGRVDERMFYGPQLELWTEISTSIGSDSFQIEDSLTNHGGSEQEFQIIYHGNFGPGLLEEGSKLVAPIKSVTPFNGHAAKLVENHATYGAPTHGFVEEVYCIRPWADRQGNTTVMLHNAAGDRGVSMSYSISELPFLTQWKNSADRKSGYVTGIEPGTGFPYNRRVERHYGRVPTLKPGQSRHFKMAFKILDSSEKVASSKAIVERITNGRPTKTVPTPEADMSLFE
jgi:hypothetical protein